jgi:hypothetical protein
VGGGGRAISHGEKCRKTPQTSAAKPFTRVMLLLARPRTICKGYRVWSGHHSSSQGCYGCLKWALHRFRLSEVTWLGHRRRVQLQQPIASALWAAQRRESNTKDLSSYSVWEAIRRHALRCPAKVTAQVGLCYRNPRLFLGMHDCRLQALKIRPRTSGRMLFCSWSGHRQVQSHQPAFSR